MKDKKWSLIWLMIYGTFLIGDFIAPGIWPVTMVKLLGLFLCFVYACQKFPQDNLLKIAIGFTILSDVILALNNVNEWGVFTFCFAHFFHMARLAGTSPKFFAAYAAFLILTTIFGTMTGTPLMLTVGFVYAVSLMSNVLLSWQWHRRAERNPATRGKTRSKYALYGFLLFLACDLCVATSYAAYIGMLPPLVKLVADYLAWFFYFPAQVLIANSSKIVIQ